MAQQLLNSKLGDCVGLNIDRDQFDEVDFARFRQKLELELRAFGELLQRPGFGVGPASIGAELELNLVGRDARPACINQQVLALAADERLTLEANRFNLEINSRPAALQGRPLSALRAELADALRIARHAAGQLGAKVVLIGILPTLERRDLEPRALTDCHRYRALGRGLWRLRGEPFRVEIEGQDRVSSLAYEVTFEGANTSFQVHLRVEPREFAQTYNAAQLATPIVLAAAGNAPFFLGKRLWQETRVALFRQSVDERAPAAGNDWRPARVSFGHGWVRDGARELFEESVALHEPLLPVMDPEDPLSVLREGKVPSLAELRLHHGTVWRWNRAIFDPTAGGHLRIELRALPAGPTVLDTLANAALLLGLTLGLAPHMESHTSRITFGHARRNFYAAARSGLDAELLWPTSHGPSPQPVSARKIAMDLLRVARAGLIRGGVEASEADYWLELMRERLARGQTGSVWQLAEYRRERRRKSAQSALGAVLERYMELSEAEIPVHEWPRSDSARLSRPRSEPLPPPSASTI